ncbi:MAG: rhomboid family intramembrane serine protease [Halieaceae bacterium]|jgi:GlpG protein|nr:rhomboid family intramembrane serine protease [Halieaceae bacterium]
MPLELYRGGLDEDLRAFSAFLWQQGIRHRVAEEAGAQVVFLADEADRERAATYLERWRRGELRLELRSQPRAASGISPALGAALQAPVTLLLIGLAVLGFALVYFGAPVAWVARLTFQPFEIVGGRPVFGESEAQYWRFITPIFLHFGWLHIAFNSLWCWELGRRVEARLGGLNLAGLVIVMAAVSNDIQHQVSGPVLFGGLSGVVYGLLGFAWVAGRLNPRWRELAPPTPILLFMVGWLVLCLTGAFNVLGFSVANGAHVGGLVSGILLGGVFGLAFRGAGPQSS